MFSGLRRGAPVTNYMFSLFYVKRVVSGKGASYAKEQSTTIICHSEFSEEYPFLSRRDS
jgi:hypothetical protein